MSYAACKPRSSPCSTPSVGEFAPSMGKGNAYDSRYTSNPHDNDALHEFKDGLHGAQSLHSPFHSSSRPWRHRPSSRLDSLMRRQSAISSSDSSALSGDSSHHLVTSSISGHMSGVSRSLLQDPLGLSFSHLTTPTDGASLTSPVSASDISTVGGSLASPSIGGGRLSATGLGSIRASLAPRLISITDSTTFSSVQPPLSQIPSLAGKPSQSPTQPRIALTSLTSKQILQPELPNTTGGSLTTLPNPSTSIPIFSATSSTLTGLPTGISVTVATPLTTILESISTSIPRFDTVTTSLLNISSTMSTSTTTSIDPISTFTSGPASTSVITSKTSTSITTFNSSSRTPEPSKKPITSSSEYGQPASTPTESTKTFSATQGLPTHHSFPESTSLTSIRFLSTYTSTKYLTITYANGSSATHSTVAESGVLNSDKPRPDDAFAHNTGGIIGVTVSGAFVIIVILIIMFLSCQRYRRVREREGYISRGAFSRRELELDPDFPPMSPRLPVMARNHYVTMGQETGPGLASSNLSPHGHGEGGGSGENLSAESAGMYPVQSVAVPPVGGVDPYLFAPTWIPGSLGVPNSTTPGVHGISSSDNITRQPSIGPLSTDNSMVNSTGMVFLPAHVYPYENPQIMSGIRSAVSSDPYGDGDAYMGAVSSTSGHGHYSTDGHTTSACLESSSHGHTANNFCVLTSSSGHAVSMSTGGVFTSSSGHGMGYGMGIASPRARSKSDSPVVERWRQAPPSSYAPPRRGTGISTESLGSKSTSSVKSLLGKFKSMSKLKDKRKEERERRLSLHYENVRASMAQSSRESMTMSMGHGSFLGHATSHLPPSSLLNPPNPPIPSVPHMPPIPIIRYPEIIANPIPNAYTSQPASYSYVPPLPPHNPRYSIGVAISDSPYPDVWPPQVSPSIPSLVPTTTDASSYVEGLLNPNILPGPSGSAMIPSVDIAGGFGPGGEVGGSGGSGGVGRYGLWTNEYEGRSTMSLGDHVDYSRPISGVVPAARSTTTFGTDREVVNEARDDV